MPEKRKYIDSSTAVNLYWLGHDGKSKNHLFSFQNLMFMAIMLIGMQGGQTPMAGVFVLYEPKFQCNVEKSLDNLKASDLPDGIDLKDIQNFRTTTENKNLQYNELIKSEHDERCDRSKLDQCQITIPIKLNENQKAFDIPCTEFDFPEDLENPDSMVALFGLVCDKKSAVTFANSLMFVGYQTGSLLMGLYADNYGRKSCIVFSCLANFIMNLLATRVTSIFQYYIVKFILGNVVMGVYLGTFVYMDEFLHDTWRVQGNAWYAGWFGIGYGLLTYVASVWLNWKSSHYCIALTALAGFLVSLFFKESPVWLMSRGRNDEAEEIVKEFARLNGKRDWDLLG